MTDTTDETHSQPGSANGRMADRSALIAAVDDLFLKHTPAWITTLENWYNVSQNPVFAWMALRLHCDPRRPISDLPGWLTQYLHWAADNLMAAAFRLDPREVPPLIGQAIGLSAPGRTIIDDAVTLWDDPVLIALYEEFRQQAPCKARAEWAREQLRDLYRIQSTEAVRQRLIAARKTVQALLLANGEDRSDESIVRQSLQVLQTRSALAAMLDVGHSPDITAEGLRAMVEIPPARRAAIDRVLRDHKLRSDPPEHEPR